MLALAYMISVLPIDMHHHLRKPYRFIVLFNTPVPSKVRLNQLKVITPNEIYGVTKRDLDVTSLPPTPNPFPFLLRLSLGALAPFIFQSPSNVSHTRLDRTNFVIGGKGKKKGFTLGAPGLRRLSYFRFLFLVSVL